MSPALPDHLIEIAVLTHLTVDLERDAAFRQISDFGNRAQRSAWRRVIECFTDLPRPLDVTRGDSHQVERIPTP